MDKDPSFSTSRLFRRPSWLMLPVALTLAAIGIMIVQFITLRLSESSGQPLDPSTVRRLAWELVGLVAAGLLPLAALLAWKFVHLTRFIERNRTLAVPQAAPSSTGPAAEPIRPDERVERHHQDGWLFSQRVMDSSLDHISLVDRTYRYRQVNSAYERAHAVTRDLIVGRHVADLLGSEIFTADVQPRLDQCLAGDEVTFESWFSFKGVGRCCMLVRYSPLRNAGGEVEGVVVVSRDITDRKQSETKLIEKTRLAALGAELGIIVTRRDDFISLLESCGRAFIRHLDIPMVQIWLVNASGTAMDLHVVALHPSTTHPVGAEQGTRITFGDENDPPASPPPWTKLQRSLQIRWSEYEARMGRRFHCQPAIVDHNLVAWLALITTTPLNDSGTFAVATASDQIGLAVVKHRAETAVTAAHQSLEQHQHDLQALAAQLITVQEEERRRVSRELHDDLNQRLAMLAMEVDSFALAIPPQPGLIKARLSNFHKRVTEVTEEVRRLAYQLHPSILDHLGLAVAVESLAEDVAKREGLTISFRQRQLPRQLPQDIASCLYRITQEALRNIVKHAEASHISVNLSGGDRLILLKIRDNGVGFNVEHLTTGKTGLGIISMRERVRLVSGTLDLRSARGKGTVLRVKVPLPNALST